MPVSLQLLVKDANNQDVPFSIDDIITGITDSTLLENVGATTDPVTASTVVGLLKAIKAATEATSLDADTINLNADSIDLSVDQVEALLAQVRDRLPAQGSPLLVESRPSTITAAVYEAGNLVSWTQDGVDYEATYDADGNLLTQGPA